MICLQGSHRLGTLIVLRGGQCFFFLLLRATQGVGKATLHPDIRLHREYHDPDMSILIIFPHYAGKTGKKGHWV